MTANAISLVQAGNRVAATLAREHEWAEDDKAFRALVQDGRELLPALEGVVHDADFWSRLSNASAGMSTLTDEQRATLDHFGVGDLTAMLEALRYNPPPPVEVFVQDTIDAIDGVLETDLSAEARRARIRDLEYDLSSFVTRLRRMLAAVDIAAPTPARSRFRSRLRRGSKVALSLGVAAAGIATEAGLVGMGVDPSVAKFGGMTGELVATAAAVQIEDALPVERASQVEIGVQLDEIDPTVRMKAFHRLLEGALARAVVSERLTEDALDLAEIQLGRLRRAVERTGSRSEVLNGHLAAIAIRLEEARAALGTADIDRARSKLMDALKRSRQAWQIMETGHLGLAFRLERTSGGQLQSDSEGPTEEEELDWDQLDEETAEQLRAQQAAALDVASQEGAEQRAAEQRAAERRAAEQQQRRRYLQM